jgi:hypothetical protein
MKYIIVFNACLAALNCLLDIIVAIRTKDWRRAGSALGWASATFGWTVATMQLYGI